ncbi:glycosyltransferase family 52 [Shewanella algae]|uniref:glycosyltransferase family 52 n=1 Tax=Shewanella algae TaxID=38313 RepID=UPI001AAF7AA9|nr:glycosyltransferase family 52 [Shewanella algae]MBO2590367.1 hypothetical protein [Shewanella algae]
MKSSLIEWFSFNSNNSYTIINNIETVLVVGSVYSVYVYLSIPNVDAKKTLIVCASAIPEEILGKFGLAVVFSELRPGLIKVYDYFKYLVDSFPLKLFLRIKNKKIKYFGVDHLFYSDILHWNDYELVEDGSLNYIFGDVHQPLLYKLLLGKQFGLSCRCKRIYLTGIMDVPRNIEHKVYKLDLILNSALANFFEVESLNVNKDTSFLLTQPLSEDGFILESEKIDVYKNILNKMGCSIEGYNVIIKPHPRETTDYKKFFPNVLVLKAHIPFELYRREVIKARIVGTMFSSSIFGIEANKKFFAGTLGIAAIEHKFGVLREKFCE